MVELINEARRRIRIIRWRSSEDEETEIGLGTAVFEPAHSQEWEQAWLITEALLAEMNDVVRGQGAEFVVATVPAALEVTGPEPSSGDRKTPWHRQLFLSG